MKSQLDHIVIAAHTLKQGASYIKEKFGVEIPYGGEHDGLGTHNHLMQLGDNAYLEVIASNHNATSPKSPRVFCLDQPQMQNMLKHEPQIITWVVNTDEIQTLHNKGYEIFGEPGPMSRGNLQWHFSFIEGGNMPAGGFLPHVIQWPEGIHPAKKLADLNCHLNELTVHHPQADWLRSKLASIGAEDTVTVEQCKDGDLPYLSLVVTTPKGEIEINSSRVALAPCSHA